MLALSALSTGVENDANEKEYAICNQTELTRELVSILCVHYKTKYLLTWSLQIDKLIFFYHLLTILGAPPLQKLK